MGSTPIGHMIFYIALFIIVMIAIYMLVEMTITQVAFWILRPSEMVSMDLVGTVTSLGGTTGDVETNLRTYTAKIDYYINNKEKILCVISERKRESGAIVGVLSTFNCFSMPFKPEFNFIPSLPIESYIFKLEKTFQDPFVNVKGSY